MLHNNLARNLFNCAEFIRGEHISDRLNELKGNQLLSEQQIENIRLKKLKRLLIHAYSFSPFYQERLKDFNFSKIKSFEDITHIEPLSKEDLRHGIDTIQSIKPIARFRKAKTSGSTGIPLIFPKDSITKAYHFAAMYRGHSWYGLNIGDREARLWGVPVYLNQRMKTHLVDYCLNRFREKEYNLKEKTLNDFYLKLNKYRPQYIMGYGKMIYEFALYLKQNNKTLEDLQLKMVKYTSENITEEEKILINKTYCCSVVSEYGAAETGIITFQCPEGSHHIMSDCVHTEYLDNKDNNELKEILVTDLNNLSFPIIRYRLGDCVLPTQEKCMCNLPFPIIKKIQGRMSDTFSIGNKKKYHSIIFYYIMKAIAGADSELLQFRVVQKSYSTFCYQLVREQRSEKSEAKIEVLTKQELGANITVEFEYFDYLPREPSGKLRDFVKFV